MSVKKLLILTAVGVAASAGTTAALAGGPDMMAAPAPADNYFYVEGNVGYAFQDFSNQASNAFSPAGIPTTAPSAGANTNGVTGGIAYGGDFGYMFNQYIGLELGWTYLPRFTSPAPGLGFAGFASGLQFRNAGAAWGVFKLVAPLSESFDAFFKAGIGYRYGTLIFANIGPVGMQEWRPVFGAGVTYNFAQDWMTSISWMHFMGGTTYSPASQTQYVSVVAPASDVVMFSLGYKFMV